MDFLRHGPCVTAHVELSVTPHGFLKPHAACSADASCQAGQYPPSFVARIISPRGCPWPALHFGPCNSYPECCVRFTLVFERPPIYPQEPAVQEAFPDCCCFSGSHSMVHRLAGPPLTLGGGSRRKAGMHARCLSGTPVFNPCHGNMPPLSPT